MHVTSPVACAASDGFNYCCGLGVRVYASRMYVNCMCRMLLQIMLDQRDMNWEGELDW